MTTLTKSPSTLLVLETSAGPVTVERNKEFSLYLKTGDPNLHVCLHSCTFESYVDLVTDFLASTGSYKTERVLLVRTQLHLTPVAVPTRRIADVSQ